MDVSYRFLDFAGLGIAWTKVRAVDLELETRQRLAETESRVPSVGVAVIGVVASVLKVHLRTRRFELLSVHP